METHKKINDMLHRDGGVLQWAEEHNCSFGIEKFQLIDFTRGRLATRGMTGRGQSLTVREHVIKPQQSAKFLGIIVDEALNWKEQVAVAIAKGEKWISQFRRLARITKGVNATFVWRLYQSIALPRMLYGADIYLTPTRRHCTIAPNAKPTYNKTVMHKLATIQRHAAIIITGAMKTTAGTTLDVLADLTPMHLEIDKWCQNTTLTLATIHDMHPLALMVNKAATHYVIKHPSPLHELCHTYQARPKGLEKIMAIRHLSTWEPSVSILISKDKEDTIVASASFPLTTTCVPFSHGFCCTFSGLPLIDTDPELPGWQCHLRKSPPRRLRPFLRNRSPSHLLPRLCPLTLRPSRLPLARLRQLWPSPPSMWHPQPSTRYSTPFMIFSSIIRSVQSSLTLITPFWKR